jgi:hypothetical protein
MQSHLVVNLLISLISSLALSSPSVTKEGPFTIDETIQVFGSFTKLDNECIRQIWEAIPSRDVPSDRMVAHLVEKHLQEYGPGLIILDSGHAHSVAAAVRLAELGYAVEFKMEHDSDFWTTLQAVAAMKALTRRMAVAKANPSYGSRGLVIAIDSHRKRDFRKNEFPTAAKIKTAFHRRVILVTEALDRDVGDGILTRSAASKPALIAWLQRYSSSPEWANEWLLQYVQDPQIEVVQHFASPYYNQTPQAYVQVPPNLPAPACQKWEGWGF